MTETSDPTTDAARPAALDASRRTAQAVHDVAAKFMLDMDMYGEAAAVGYDGIAFYFAGRGGVLGDVGHEEVVEAFTFFPPETVRTAWESSASVEDRGASARRFADYASSWAQGHLPADGVDYARLAELTGKVIDAADGERAPVFAGWRALDDPDDDRALALHRMNALRELRAARHGEAVREVGLEPVEAFMIRTPYMAGVFGWSEPESGPDDDARTRWERAEALTDDAFAADLAVLDDDELAELIELTDALLAAAG